MQLSISCVIDLNGADVAHSPPVIERKIQFASPRRLGTKRWFGMHWRSIITTLDALASAIAAWVAIATG